MIETKLATDLAHPSLHRIVYYIALFDFRSQYRVLAISTGAQNHLIRAFRAHRWSIRLGSAGARKKKKTKPYNIYA